MARDYNPRRYRTRTQSSGIDNTENYYQMWGRVLQERNEARAELEKVKGELDALRDTIEVLDRGLNSTSRNLDLALDTQHRYRVAFMLFAQKMRPNMGWQELWVYWLQQAERKIQGR